MLSLPELSQTYKNSHPHYINPLAYFDVTDHELADLKREALLPYLENLEEKMVIYRARMVAFVVLFDVNATSVAFVPMSGDSISFIFLNTLNAWQSIRFGKLPVPGSQFAYSTIG